MGYDKDNFNRITIIEEEAKIIRYIYSEYIKGVAPPIIAKSLMKARITTVTGNPVWSSSAIYRILRNEKYCGDVLMQKTFTKDCFSHRRIKNTGQKKMFFLENALPAIISKTDWKLVQELLITKSHIVKINRNLIKKDIYLTKVKTGVLKGFTIVDYRWNKDKTIQVMKKLNIIKESEYE